MSSLFVKGFESAYKALFTVAERAWQRRYYVRYLKKFAATEANDVQRRNSNGFQVYLDEKVRQAH
jgi:hypothetical protein